MSTNSYDVFSKPDHIEIAKYIIQCCTSVTFINRANKAHAIRERDKSLRNGAPLRKGSEGSSNSSHEDPRSDLFVLSTPIRNYPQGQQQSGKTI